MKKLLLLLVVLPFVFSACSDDDDYSKDIVGTWSFTKSEASQVVTNKDALTKAIKELVASLEIEGDYMVTFTSNREFSFEDEDGVFLIGTYSLKGDKVILKIESESTELPIRIGDNILSLYYDYTEDFQDEDMIEHLIGAEAAKGATVSKVIIVQFFTKKK